MAAGSTTTPAGPDEKPRHEGSRKLGWFNRTLHTVGETLITIGCVLLLFVVYEVWVSNWFSHRRQHQLHEAFVKGADPLNGQDRLGLPSGKQVIIPLGQGIANLYIPRFGKDYAQTVIEGVGDDQLAQGPGHYPGSAIPGQVGNFAMAGHRVGKGEPFLNLDKLRPGDAVVVQTKTNWYIYRVLGDVKLAEDATKVSNKSQRGDEIERALATLDKQGVPGREIVAPTAVQVIAPVPDHPGSTPEDEYLTMTTCHPKYTADSRMILHAKIARSVPVKGDQFPKELSGGTL